MALDWGHCELDHCGLGGRAGRAGAGAGQVTPAGASSSGPHGVRGQGNAAGTDVTEDPASRISFFFFFALSLLSGFCFVSVGGAWLLGQRGGLAAVPGRRRKGGARMYFS